MNGTGIIEHPATESLTGGPVAAQDDGLPAGISREQLDRYEARKNRYARASLVPLPGALRWAFAPAGSPTGGPELRPVTLGDFLTLARLDHPLYRAADPTSCLTLWNHRQRKQAARLFGLKSARGTIQSDFIEHVRRAFDPIVSYEARKAEDGSFTIESGEQDSPGWWLSLYGMLRRECGCSRAEALAEPLAEAWALHVLRQEQKPYLERVADCYVAQESETEP